MNGNAGRSAEDGIEIVQENGNKEETSNQQYPYYLRRRRSSGRGIRFHQRREPKLIRRLLRKNGKATIYRKQIPQHYFRYLNDLGNTLINTRWKWTIVTLATLFLTTWLIFACIWMLISYSNGDLDENPPNEAPCLVQIQGFMGYFLFSMETQSTIGYGKREITRHCPEAIFLMVVQLIFGSGLCGALVSIVYAKMISPNRFRPRASFSKFAVICQRDGVLCLLFRVRDEYKHYEQQTKINAYLVINRIGGPCLKRIILEKPGPLIWPIEIVHKITGTSPFWDLSAKDLILKRFELIVTMEGLSEATSQASKTSTSYMSTEIRWGSRFKRCIEIDKNGTYVVVRKRFNECEEVLTPLCSAKRLQEVLGEMSTRTSKEVYTPSKIYTPTFNRIPYWEEIVEGDEENNVDQNGDSSSGIGSLRTDLLSPVSTRSSGTVTDSLLSPVSTRSNVTVTVADVHRFDEIEEESEQRNRDMPDNTIYTVHELHNEELAGGDSSDEGRFVYMEDRYQESSSDDSDAWEEDESSSPYARRRPYSIELRRNSIELRRNRVSQQDSNRSSGSSLLASLQNYTSIIFTRQTSRNVIETDF